MLISSIQTMFRKFVLFSMALTLVWSTVGCGNNSSLGEPYSDLPQSQSEGRTIAAAQRLSDGKYPIQQATYNDAEGEYRVALLNTKPGESSMFSSTNLAMARLTEEEVAAGEKSYLKVEKGQPSLHLTEDYKIEYVHNVTETQTNPSTGQPQTVVVRQESSFWTPFAGALAGQAIGSLLFRPQYYMPPIYQPGIMTGYGSYGTTYNQAVSSYQQRYSRPPAEVRNRQAFRTTGQLRSPSSSRSRLNTPRASTRDRSTGSGFGTNTLRRNNRSTYNQRSRGSFGSSGSRMRSNRSFGTRRR